MSLYAGIELPGCPDLENVRRLDALPMRSVREMMAVGFAIDVPYFEQLTGELTLEADVLKREICDAIPEEKLSEFMERSGLGDEDDLPMNVESGDQLAELLFNVLGIGKDRTLKLTKSGKRLSTGKKQLEQLKRGYPVIQKILSYRERSKIINTYTSKFPLIAKQHHEGKCWCGFRHKGESVRIHTQLMTTRTATGRLASKAPNMQNVGSRTELGRRVRRGFVASPGMRIVGCDYSQVEMRLGGHYSRDKRLLHIFNNGLDPHVETAKGIFNVEVPDKATQRDPSKNLNFGIFYGLTETGLMDQIALAYSVAGKEVPDWVTRDWCKEFIEKWFKLYAGVGDYLKEQHYRARRYGCVWDLFGRVRKVPEVRSVHKNIEEAGLRQAGNMPIQATCAGLMKLGLASVQDRIVDRFRWDGIECNPLITVHDEMLVEVEEGYEELVKAQMEVVMGEVMEDVKSGESKCRVPIEASGKVMERWEK